MQVQAGMCRKPRVGKNTVKTDATCDTHRKTPKKTMRNAELNMFLHSAARRLADFLAIKHRENRCESKNKVQLRANKVPKLEFQHMPAKESHHPARRQTHRLPTTTTTTTTPTTTTTTTMHAPEARCYRCRFAGFGVLCIGLASLGSAKPKDSGQT